MKYKVGDRVRIVSETAEGMNWISEMDVYLGKVMTIKHTVRSTFSRYCKMAEDDGEYYWDDSMIAGLASETPFDFDAWKGMDVCMHCKTKEEAEDFCREMDKAGLRWSNGESYLELSNFRNHENHICYFFNNGAYSGYEYAKTKGCTVLEWSDYRSTKPKGEQEKTMGTKIDEPLSYQEAMRIFKKLCKNEEKFGCLERECPLYHPYRDELHLTCFYALHEYSDEIEPILKKWLAEHPVKTNRDKFVEFFGEIQKYDDECEYHCVTVPCQSCDWWHQEYVEPEKAKVE